MTVAATYCWPVMRIHSKIWVTMHNVPYHGLSKSQPTNPYFNCIYFDIKKFWEGNVWAFKIWNEGSFTQFGTLRVLIQNSYFPKIAILNRVRILPSMA
jgi:hypothetical protein